MREKAAGPPGAARIFLADAVYFGPRNLSWATRHWRLGRNGASFRRIALYPWIRTCRRGHWGVAFFGFAFRCRWGLRVFRGKVSLGIRRKGRAAFLAAMRALFIRLAATRNSIRPFGGALREAASGAKSYKDFCVFIGRPAFIVQTENIPSGSAYCALFGHSRSISHMSRCPRF